MNPKLGPATGPKNFWSSTFSDHSGFGRLPLQRRTNSRLAAYVVLVVGVFTSMAAAAGLASSELPLMLGGL